MTFCGPFIRAALLAASGLLVVCNLGSGALAQNPFVSHNLPDAPEPQAGTPLAETQASTRESQVNPPSGGAAAQQAGTAIVSGTVLDANGAVLQGARVTLVDASGSFTRTVQSGNDGQFVFSNLPPQVYKLTVSAPGMNSFTADQIAVRPGEFRIVPPVRLSVSTVITSVTVNANTQELAEQQVQIATQQRIANFIPNFYSSYDWDAPAMGAKQKFELSFRSIIDPVTFLTVAGIAGAEQHQNIFPAYGGGLSGYGKRYGAALADSVSGTLLGKAVYPSVFHQDPRYFYKGQGSTRSRVLYALSRAVIARGDDGQAKPNYSGVFGNFTASAISNLYYPPKDRGVSLVLLNGLAQTGADAVSNLVREFLLKRITSNVPKGQTFSPDNSSGEQQH